MTHLPRINTYAVVGKETRHWQRRKRLHHDACYVAAGVCEKTLSSEEIKPIALCIVELRLAEGIS